MQSFVSVTAKFDIPVHYRCSKCGTTVHAVIPVSGTGMTNRHGHFNFEREGEIIGKARTDAREMLESSVKSHYKRDAAYQCQNIIGQCPCCGNLEAWQQDPQRIATTVKLTNMLPTAALRIALIGVVVVVASMNNFLLGVLTFVAALGLFFLVAILLNKISGKKEISKDPIGFMNKAGVPEASRPQYTQTLEEILPRLDADIRYT